MWKNWEACGGNSDENSDLEGTEVDRVQKMDQEKTDFFEYGLWMLEKNYLAQGFSNTR